MSYAQPHASGRRFTGLIVTVALHIVLIYALIHGLARKIVEVVAPPLETKIIAEVKPPQPEKPPPPPPKLATPPPPFIPPPEVNIQMPVQQAPTITAVAPTPPPPAPITPTPPAPPQMVSQPETVAGTCDPPAYQPAWRRAGEEGEVTLRLLVDVTGRVIDAKVERSSRYRRLDDAAREAALECRYRPAMGSDGRPMRASLIKIYKFRLTD